MVPLRRVTGEVVLPADASPRRDATIAVRLLDVSEADAPARVVAEWRKEGLTIEAGGHHAFSLAPRRVTEKAHYVVDAHVDADGDGVAGPGDYITMASHPVLTFGHPDEVTVVVRRIENV